MIRNPLALSGAIALTLAAAVACGPRGEKEAEQAAESTVAATEQGAKDVAAAVTPAAAPTTAAEFVPLATKIILFEVDSGKLAQEKAQAPAIKTFAKNVATDFGRMREQLAAAAGQAGLQASVPTALDGEWATRLADLRAAPAAEFGHMYLGSQAEAQEDALTAFEAYAAGGDNLELRAWARDALPALRVRLAEARELYRSDLAGTDAAAPAAAKR